jgi:hypothetical protein
VRLQSLLNKDLPEPQWREVAEKLAEAQVAANEPEATLVLLTDARLRDLPWAKFWRAQALPVCTGGLTRCRFTRNWLTTVRHFREQLYLARATRYAR